MTTLTHIHNIHAKLYDDYDRYFDYLHDFSNDIHDYIKDNGLPILDCDKFTDFFEFCLDHLNYPVVDNEICDERLQQMRDNGECFSDNDTNDYDYDFDDDDDEDHHHDE